MPIYRTHSDRGLWKKYRSEQPQHFHKACYLENSKEKPQVTYSQLDLGDRPYSRQSNPNIRSDLDSANGHHWKRSRIKSAPATPRATTPTRIRSRNRAAMMNGSSGGGDHSPPEVPEELVRVAGGVVSGVGARPTTATSVISQETGFSGYPDDYGSSLDSRSLGRDSALGPYMSQGMNGGNGGYRDTPDRPNPFIHGSMASNYADNVVDMFLKNMNDPSLGVVLDRRPPGRIENLPANPTGHPINQASPHEPLEAGNGTYETDTYKGGNSVSKTVMQLRKEFLEGTTTSNSPSAAVTTSAATVPPKTVDHPPKTNKYLRPENRWSKPSNLRASGTLDQTESVTTDMVQGFVAPQMVYAEKVHVRQDSTSTEESADITLKDSSMIPAPAQVESNGHRFEDTAYSNYIADVTSSSTEVSNTGGGPPKKKGFFSSIFKKPPSSGGKSNKKSNSRKKDYYEVEQEETSVLDDDDMADFDQQIQNDSNFFHQHLIDDINASMIAHPSSSILEANTEVRPPTSLYEHHPEHDHQDGLPPSQPLTITRKRSMSKPTDLDEILRLQEAEEAAAAESANRQQLEIDLANEMPGGSYNTTKADDVFFNDPFFRDAIAEFEKPALPERQNMFTVSGSSLTAPTLGSTSRNVPINLISGSNEDPIYENSLNRSFTQHPPSMETTQEIDVDAALGYPPDEQALENIEWPTPTDLIAPTTDQQQFHQGLEPAVEVELDYAPPTQVTKEKPKRSIFSFGKKKKNQKPGKNDEVSYYVEEPQPEPRTPDDTLEIFHDINNDEEQAFEKFRENKTPPPPTAAAKKPTFFLFKSKKNKNPPAYAKEEDAFTTEDELDIQAPEVLQKEIHQDPALMAQSGAEENITNTDTELVLDPSSPKNNEINLDVLPDVQEQQQQQQQQLGPIREVKALPEKQSAPSFFNFRSKKKFVETTRPPAPPIPEPVENIDDTEQPPRQPLQRSQSSRDSSPKRSSTKSKSRDASPHSNQRNKPKGLAGFFKSGSKQNKNKNSQIGTMAPVDVSHLVDDDEEFENGVKDHDQGEKPELSVQYTKPQIHLNPEEVEQVQPQQQQQSISKMVQNDQQQNKFSYENSVKVTTNTTNNADVIMAEADNIAHYPEDHHPVDAPAGGDDVVKDDQRLPEEPVEEVSLPVVPQSRRSTGSLSSTRGRQKEKKKSGGLMSGFFSAKPPQSSSRPPSQTRARTPENQNPQQRPPFIRDRRSKSLPRQRGPNNSRSGGLADFFNTNSPAQQAQTQLPPPSLDPQADQTEEVGANSKPEIAHQEQEQQPPISVQRRPPPKSKSHGGISSFFNMQPKQPRRPRGPPPSPPQRQEEEVINNRKLSTANSVTSISSQRRRDSKGLSNFLGSSPLRKSSRSSGNNSMPRSQTVDLVPHQSNSSANPSNNPATNGNTKQPDYDKIEQSTEPEPPLSPQSSNVPRNPSTSSIPPPNQTSGRVMGRRSGRFRKTSAGGDQNNIPSQLLKGPHVVPPAPAPNASTEQSVMRDIFAEAVNRPSRGPSRRGSMSSLNQTSASAAAKPDDFLPADSEYDQAMSANYHDSGNGNNSKVGRTDSYRQAKNSAISSSENAARGGNQMRNYNSLPRLGKGAKHSNQQQRQPRNNPETRSLGPGDQDVQQPHARQQRRGGGGRKGDDNCQMM